MKIAVKNLIPTPFGKGEILSLENVLKESFKRHASLIEKHGMPKLGRWNYCKYCYRNVSISADLGEGIIICNNCGYGLAPLAEVIKLGSYQKWREKIELDFCRCNRYLTLIDEGKIEPTGTDEFGKVPYICPICKAKQATVFKREGNFCKECDPDLCPKCKTRMKTRGDLCWKCDEEKVQ